MTALARTVCGWTRHQMAARAAAELSARTSTSSLTRSQGHDLHQPGGIRGHAQGPRRQDHQLRLR